MAKTSLGLDSNISALLCYVLGWISGLIIILIEKNDANVRFHAMQSIITFGGLTLLSILLASVLFFLGFLIPLINLIGIVLWILLMVKAYQGEKFMLPIIGEMAEEWSKKV
jgi:uncharacterized membrane protein